MSKTISIHPTGPFTFFEFQDQEIGEFYIIQGRRATDFERVGGYP